MFLFNTPLNLQDTCQAIVCCIFYTFHISLCHDYIYISALLQSNIDIKEILSIADLVSNRLNQDNRNNKYVKEELQKRLHYV